MADARLTIGLLSVALCLGCAPRVASSPPPPAPAPAVGAPARGAPADAGIVDGGYGRVADGRAAVELSLPDAARWSVGHRSGWLVAEHGPTGTTITSRAWRAEGVVNRDRCEAEARRGLPSLPDPSGGESLAARDARVPRGYDTRWRLWVGGAPSGAARGTLLAFGANLRRCVALIGEVDVSGPEAERTVIARLVLVAERVLPSLGVRDVEARVRRQAR